MTGEQVFQLRRIAELAAEKRSLIYPETRILPFRKSKPAAFVLRMSGEMILRLIKSGLYVYETSPIKTGE